MQIIFANVTSRKDEKILLTLGPSLPGSPLKPLFPAGP